MNGIGVFLIELSWLIKSKPTHLHFIPVDAQTRHSEEETHKFYDEITVDISQTKSQEVKTIRALHKEKYFTCQ